MHTIPYNQMDKTMEKSFAEQGLMMYFVLDDKEDLNDSPQEFKEAYERSMEKSIAPKLIRDSEIKVLKIHKRMVIVLQKFSGDVFSFLRKSPCLLLGPRCVLECLMKGEPTPEGPHPVFTLAMKKICVCVSGFTQAQKTNLQEKVQFMGGRFDKSFVDRVTHLVVTHTQTEKYNVAIERHIPVMQERWIHEAWDLSQRQSIHALDPPLGSLTCPTFLALKVCVSQVNKAKKAQIKQMVESKGGSYSPTLTESETDVLVVGSGSSDKIMYAKKWKIPCVSERWVKDSYDAGYALKYDKYEVESERCSTPESNKTFVDPNFSMLSCIQGGRNMINETIMSEVSFLEPEPRASQQPKKQRGLSCSKNSTSMQDSTANCTKEASLTSSIAADPRTPEKTLEASASKDKSFVSKEQAISETLKQIEKLELSDVKKAGAFLDGCKVYLSGFSTSPLLDRVRKFLNCGGATRFDQITDGVSHVLVAGAGLSGEEQRTLRQGHVQPNVVSAQWLLASLNQRHPANVEPYLCFENQQNSEPSPASKKGLQMWQKQAPPSGPSTSSAAAQSDILLVKQYIQFDDGSPDRTQMDGAESPAKAAATSSRSKEPQEEEEEEELAQPLAEDEEAERDAAGAAVTLQQDNKEQDESLPQDSSTTDQSKPVFKGLKFWVAELSNEERAHMKNLVVELGGMWQQKPADYAVVPLRGTKSKCQAKNIVTTSWVEDCVDAELLLPVEYYHKPMPDYAERKKPLEGCVMAVSSYVGRERNYLAALSTELGALFQEVFAKKRAPDRNAEASTHLLCPIPSGSKYTAAAKWKLPVVTKDWLLACAEDGAHLDEEPFLIPGSTMASKSHDNNASKINISEKNTPQSTPSVNVLSASRITRNSTLGSVSSDEQKNKPAEKKVLPEIAKDATPVSAVPSRLRGAKPKTLTEKMELSEPAKEPVTPQSGSNAVADVVKTPSIQNVASNFITPNAHSTSKTSLTSNLKTPNEHGKSSMSLTPNRSVQFQSPQEFKTPSQQYTPYTPAAPKPQPVVAHATKTNTAPAVDVATLTPKSYDNYWESKVPGNIPTPETPYGAVFQANPSASTRKVWKNYIDSIPDEYEEDNLTHKPNAETPMLECRKRVHEAIVATQTAPDVKRQKQAQRPPPFDTVAKQTDENSEDEEQRKEKQAKKFPTCFPETPNAKQTGASGASTPSSASSFLRRRKDSEEQQEECMEDISHAGVEDEGSKVRTKLKFMLTGLEGTEREALDGHIQELGGELSSTTSFDPTASHLLMTKPLRSEKLLASIAAGKWILHPSYLLECHKKGHFIPEEEFEWGNPKAANLPVIKEKSLAEELAAACFRWRSKLQSLSSSGAYSGMVAIVHGQQGKTEAFTRLIKAGGGNVVDIKPPFSDPQNATHCFVDLNRNISLDLKALEAKRVPCLNAIYLNDYLIKDPPQTPQQWLADYLNKSKIK